MSYITAKQLAEMLLENPDDIVAVVSDNFELNHATIPYQRYAALNRFKGNLSKETFRDAFDGGSYDKEIVRMDDKGDHQFVKI